MGNTTNADIGVADQSISSVVGEILDGIVEEAVAYVSSPCDAVPLSTPAVPLSESIRRDKPIDPEDSTQPNSLPSFLHASPTSFLASLDMPSDETAPLTMTKRVPSSADKDPADIDAVVEDIVYDIVDKAATPAYQKQQLLTQARSVDTSSSLGGAIAEALESSARRAAERDVPIIVISSDDDDDDEEEEDLHAKKGMGAEARKKRRNGHGGGGGRDFARMLARYSRPREDYGRGQTDIAFAASRRSSYTTGSRDLLSTFRGTRAREGAGDRPPTHRYQPYHRGNAEIASSGSKGEGLSQQNQERGQEREHEQDTNIVSWIQRRRDRGLGIDFAAHLRPPPSPPDPEQVIDLTTDSEPEEQDGGQGATPTASDAADPKRTTDRERKRKAAPEAETAQSHGPIGRIALAAIAASRRGEKRWKY